VEKIIAEPIRSHDLIKDDGAVRRRVGELLTDVGLSPLDSEKYPHEFSGGQRQRISIARALSSNPEFLVCDEPTSALDVSVQAQILNLMKDLQREHGLTYLFISHNLAVVSHISTRVGVMYLGRIVEIADTKVIFDRPLHPYTRMLESAIPDITMSGKPRTPVAERCPIPSIPRRGCTFNPRCPHVREKCREVRPELLPFEGRASPATASTRAGSRSTQPEMPARQKRASLSPHQARTLPSRQPPILPGRPHEPSHRLRHRLRRFHPPARLGPGAVVPDLPRPDRERRQPPAPWPPLAGLLPAALAAVADGGQVWILDSANYNVAPVSITKSVTILAVPGAIGSLVATAGNAIDINTAGVKVVLRNLLIGPLPGGGGVDGIHMLAGSALTVENCVIGNMPTRAST
jgi:oligopeptide/dipeptide ABC transporter ATP-binding protein